MVGAVVTPVVTMLPFDAVYKTFDDPSSLSFWRRSPARVFGVLNLNTTRALQVRDDRISILEVGQDPPLAHGRNMLRMDETGEALWDCTACWNAGTYASTDPCLDGHGHQC